jgi:mannose-6-phosphate isomerase-like protein (cupin superfamily)
MLLRAKFIKSLLVLFSGKLKEAVMKRFVPDFDADFKVLHSTRRSQAAIMVLKAGESTGGDDNRHENSDQWMYVMQGTGTAEINGEEVDIVPGSLLLIEAGENHMIKNTGVKNLETINFYSPPEY